MRCVRCAVLAAHTCVSLLTDLIVEVYQPGRLSSALHSCCNARRIWPARTCGKALSVGFLTGMTVLNVSLFFYDFFITV